MREGIWAETLAGRSTDELLEAAIAHVGDLCAERKTWRMCVPPQWDDSDALLAGTLRRCRKELAESRAALDAAREQVQHVITDRDASRGEMQQWKEKWRETQEALDAARRNLANERAAFDSLKGANQQALGALDAARKERAIDREAFEDLDRERVKEITREKARADGMQQERDAARAEAEAIIRGLLDSIDAYYFIHEPKPDSEWDEYAYWMGPRWLAAHRFVNPNPPQEETGRGKVGEG